MFSPMIGENHFYRWFVIWSVGENYHQWLKNNNSESCVGKNDFLVV